MSRGGKQGYSRCFATVKEAALIIARDSQAAAQAVDEELVMHWC